MTMFYQASNDNICISVTSNPSCVAICQQLLLIRNEFTIEANPGICGSDCSVVIFMEDQSKQVKLDKLNWNKEPETRCWNLKQRGPN
jgi:hypothetical protein